jgi:AcrR family transcriptional regulator
MATSRRTDARRNREAILRAADEAFTDDDPRAVPLAEIAHRAGLGRATVYRYFPDRRAMAAAVAEEYFEALRQAVDASEEDRLPFRDLLQWVMDTLMSMRPLVTVMRELPEHDRRRYFGELIGILTPPLRLAQADGQLRPDIGPTDLAMVLLTLDHAAVAELVDADRGAAVQRLVAIVLDGLFTPDSAHPGRAVGGADAAPDTHRG